MESLVPSEVGNQKSDVRMIYSSGKDIKDLVASGEMRLDFYFRLKTAFVSRFRALEMIKTT